MSKITNDGLELTGMAKCKALTGSALKGLIKLTQLNLIGSNAVLLNLYRLVFLSQLNSQVITMRCSEAATGEVVYCFRCCLCVRAISFLSVFFSFYVLPCIVNKDVF